MISAFFEGTGTLLLSELEVSEKSRKGECKGEEGAGLNRRPLDQLHIRGQLWLDPWQNFKRE